MVWKTILMFMCLPFSLACATQPPARPPTCVPSASESAYLREIRVTQQKLEAAQAQLRRLEERLKEEAEKLQSIVAAKDDSWLEVYAQAQNTLRLCREIRKLTPYLLGHIDLKYSAYKELCPQETVSVVSDR